MENSKNKLPEGGENRRDLLKAMGVGGLAIALSGLAPSALFTPAGEVSTSDAVRSVANVASLLAVDCSSLPSGAKFIVGGYYKEGDGGAKVVTWNPKSTKADNGGTVHNPYSSETTPGRFEVVGSGVGDYRWFGVLDDTVSADAALDAMLADETISVIEAHTNLLFKERHRITRSRITLNFNGFKVSTYGIEDSDGSDPFGAVFFFTGETYGRQTSHVLASGHPEYWDTYEVGDATQFAVGEWYTLICDANSGGSEDKELQKMCCVVEIVDSTHVRFDYKCGWSLRAGRTIYFQHVNPIHDVRVENMIFEGAGRPTTSAGANGSHPLAFEFATRCDVFNVHGTQVFWPLIIRRYNTHYITEKCSLYNPIEVQVGGTGYLTQQIHCIYGSVRDCHASKARHLNDCTSSAYIEVENCHNSGDNMGPFVTHGQYEHDLTYIGNSGLLSFANSGDTWGNSAKNIVVKKHVGTRVVADKCLTNLTLEDVHVFYQEGATDNSGSIWANADGLVIRNCYAQRMISLRGRTFRSNRPNIIEGCTFGAVQGYYFARSDTPVQVPLIFRDCKFTGVEGNFFCNTGSTLYENCQFLSSTTTAKPIEWHASELTFKNCTFDNTGIYITGQTAQQISLKDCVFTGGSSYPRIAIYNYDKATTLDLDGCKATLGDGETFINVTAGCQLAHFTITNSTLEGGKNEYNDNFLTSDAYLIYRNNLIKGFDRGAFPNESSKITYSSNISL